MVAENTNDDVINSNFRFPNWKKIHKLEHGLNILSLKKTYKEQIFLAFLKFATNKNKKNPLNSTLSVFDFNEEFSEDNVRATMLWLNYKKYTKKVHEKHGNYLIYLTQKSVGNCRSDVSILEEIKTQFPLNHEISSILKSRLKIANEVLEKFK